MRAESARVPKGMLGLVVRITVECHYHGSHSTTISGPFLWAIDAVTLFRDVCADCDRWVVVEYKALDYAPDIMVGDWV